ncbi:MAG: hypothetical protein GVY18_18250, partial [Bacteroidetes bacterium]|nr:hypothetical protein [Bacteroidota bacterium]
MVQHLPWDRAWLFLAALLGLAVGGAVGVGDVRAQGTGEPQALLFPRSAVLSADAGAQASASVRLINNGTTPLTYRWRGGAADGPAAASYGWVDSTEPDGPSLDWMDVAPDGVPPDGTRLPMQEDQGASVALPFAFPFYGVIYRSVTVSPNGYLTFGGADAAIADVPLPSPAAPRALIAPFWDNLAPELLGSVATYYDAEAERFIVQYTDVARGPRAFQERVTFQVILQPDGTIQFLYEAVPGADRVTIGLQNDLQTVGHTLAHNAPYAEAGRAVTWHPRPAYVQPDPVAGTVGPSQQALLTVSASAQGLAPGVYRSTLVLETSDPARPVLTVPVRLDVGQEATPFRVTPEQVDVQLRRGETATVPLTITNQDPDAAQAFRVQVQQPMPDAAAASKQDEPQLRDPSDRRPVGRPATRKAVGYSSNVLGAGGFVSLDLDQPGILAELAPSPISFAGDFPFGTDQWFFILTDETHLLQRVDVETGRRATVGLAAPDDPRERWSGLAVDPTDGTLYASTTVEDGGSTLYEIDARTATATRTASLEDAAVVTALAIDGAGQLYGVETREDQLLRIDKRTGATSVVGTLGFDANFDQGLDVDLTTGTMYLTALEEGVRAQLRRVDPATGQARVVAPLSGGVHLGYLALPSGALVQPSVREGVVPPGSTVTVEATVRAADLVAGDYEAEVHVEAPDRAGVPSVTVPVRLRVLGDPRINVLFRELAFGRVFVGGSSTLPLLVQNVGNDVLEITQVRAASSAFSAVIDPLPLRITPGGIRTIQVRFHPAQVGAIQAELTIESDDPARPSVTVPLRGEGAPAPTVIVEPEAVALQVAEGQVIERSLAVRNPGGSPLEYAVRVEEDDLMGAVPPVLREGFVRGIPPSWLVVDRADTGIRWQPHSAYPGESNYTGGTGLAAMVSSSAAPGLPFDAELWSPALQASTSNLRLTFRANFVTRTQVDTRLELDLSTDQGQSWTTLREWTEDLGGLLGPGAMVEVDLSPHVEAGETFRLRWRYVTTDAAPTDFYAQIDDVEVRPVTDVLTVSRPAGTVPPGGEESVPVVVDASGVLPGQYEARLVLTTNAPTALERTVPITLDVVEGLQASIGPYELHPNGTATVPLLLSGRDIDAVRSYRLGVDYDPELLRLRDVLVRQTASEPATVTVDTTTAGTVRVDADGVTFDATDPGAQALLVLDVQARERLGTTPLAWADLALNGGDAPVTTSDGAVEVVPLYGDATLDLTITYSDAALVSRAAIGLVGLGEAARAAADVSGDGDVDTQDAQLIRNFVEDVIACFPVE